jgi:hypothetical protein
MADTKENEITTRIHIQAPSLHDDNFDEDAAVHQASRVGRLEVYTSHFMSHA